MTGTGNRVGRAAGPLGGEADRQASRHSVDDQERYHPPQPVQSPELLVNRFTRHLARVVATLSNIDLERIPGYRVLPLVLRPNFVVLLRSSARSALDLRRLRAAISLWECQNCVMALTCSAVRPSVARLPGPPWSPWADPSIGSTQGLF